MRATVIVVLDRLRLGGAVRRMRAAAGRAQSELRGLVWKVDVLRLSTFGVRVRTVSGDGHQDEVPVIVCFWSRPHRIRAVIETLAAQRDCPPLRLIIWNNDRRNNGLYRAAIAGIGSPGVLSRVEFGSARRNLGGIARFLVARTVTSAARPEPFIMIDDDQDLSDRFVAETLAFAAPCTYAGVWAFKLGEGYWDRSDPIAGEAATYVGTGGSVCDSALAHEPAFFRRLPHRYGFVEDLWASAFVLQRGWSLLKTDARLTFVDDDVNQYPKMVWLKAEFFEYLRERLGYCRDARPTA